jgi:hypothetical protein
MQLAALAYGLYTVYQVRPVALVFEIDRFRVVTAGDVHMAELPQAPEAYRQLPLTGPWLLGTRAVQSGQEHNDALFMGLDGVDVGQRPKFWQPYALSRSAALTRAKPVAGLMARYPAQKAEIDAALREAGVTAADARFLPLRARKEWVALLNATGDVVGFAPLDGFF